jgi:hypothetical protein
MQSLTYLYLKIKYDKIQNQRMILDEFTKNEDDFKKYLSENYINKKTFPIIKE